MPLNNHGFKKQTVFIILAITVLCMLFSALIVSTIIERRFLKNYSEEKATATEILAHALGPIIELYDFSQVERILASFVRYEHIASISVYDAENKLIRSAGKQHASTDMLEKAEATITNNGKIIGRFEIFFSKEPIIRQIRTTITTLIMCLAGFFLILGVGVNTFMQRSLIGPLETFTETVNRMGPRNLSFRLPEQQKNELGVLAAAFNSMAEKLEESDNARQEAYDAMEIQVRERTCELENKTEKLKKSQTALTYLLEDVNEAMQEVERANKRLQELDRLKSMFIASMSHELRTPLNSIIGFTGIILQGLAGDINDEQQDQLQRVYNAARHLLALITDVIDISKIEAGRIESYPEEFRFEELVREAVSNVTSLLGDKSIEFSVDIPPGLRLRTDRRRLLQCLLNYLSNAARYTEHGTITLSAKTDGDLLIMSVHDTGIGIREEDIPLLFKSFVRLDSHLKIKIPGTGLGLYLTKKIATEILHGSVSATSMLGKGSNFSITIPMQLKGPEK